jgi:hypothetical protein
MDWSQRSFDFEWLASASFWQSLAGGGRPAQVAKARLAMRTKLQAAPTK